jgi:uncharacterized membrane protein
MFKNEKLNNLIGYVGFICALGTFVSGVMTSNNLNSNHLVKSHLNTKAAIVSMWVLFSLIFWFGGVMNSDMESKTIGYVLSFTVLSFILVIVNSILLAKRKKIIEKENKENEKSNKKLKKVNFNIIIFSLTINIVTFIFTSFFSF